MNHSDSSSSNMEQIHSQKTRLERPKWTHHIAFEISQKHLHYDFYRFVQTIVAQQLHCVDGWMEDRTFWYTKDKQKIVVFDRREKFRSNVQAVAQQCIKPILPTALETFDWTLFFEVNNCNVAPKFLLDQFVFCSAICIFPLLLLIVIIVQG